MGAPTFPLAQNPAKCLDGMRFLLVQPWERKNESKQVLERLHNARRAGFCVSREGIGGGSGGCRGWKLSPSSVPGLS